MHVVRPYHGEDRPSTFIAGRIKSDITKPGGFHLRTLYAVRHVGRTPIHTIAIRNRGLTHWYGCIDLVRGIRWYCDNHFRRPENICGLHATKQLAASRHSALGPESTGRSEPESGSASTTFILSLTECHPQIRLILSILQDRRLSRASPVMYYVVGSAAAKTKTVIAVREEK
ncbi:uncharacterized protein BO80DRAFT_53721 [Aspergillus ibericus CBS 121593]|uniref:Uncharacterized protein n=1 Tax=Aspergillus ibericus CBS 121593 TaxID=1448316 RepID=A0A395H469_9EURO|nr:hypothetical protein BO80DRAFT_53721 [Aspergillus ibericus CBS 121593]RAL01658.1 hypothetical protein BO80DRAFT_53721 [Aspergillus ibericus CBS 121593]